ncbi:MAG: AI-2E family transporter [Magnetococcales bacterium]|nr:AI-2E family transporter [Magnetococcales bacterium]MBF0149286.1 AI-2E family transporter [Magnetococcales bacterium]MBF0172819.1 AI-2E family transporter [Magnetococcales bacterium]MBF0347352.1 AI-2E family transporter [Magnetococcales bacterium]MBF0631618.1 AI-2E family transporter [Magnetococcales bacterium]
MMKNKKSSRSSVQPPYQQGFMLLLLTLATGGLLWLFIPFIPGLFLAVLLATATYSPYQYLSRRFSIGSEKAALIMTVLILLLVVSPVLYLLSAVAVMVGDLAGDLRAWFSGFQSREALAQALGGIIQSLPFPRFLGDFLLTRALGNQEALIQAVTSGLLFLVKGITHNSLAFVSSLVWVVFSLFFFYRDGPKLISRMRYLTPLSNRDDDFLLNRFAGLATVLTLSTLTISLLQGVSFALVVAFLGLPWFFLGVSLAVASFIPVLGGLIVWGPLSYHLFMTGRTGAGVFLLFWGAIVNGFLIDNVLRPIVIGHLSSWRATEDPHHDLSALGHTLLTTLATFGGIMTFGILGLFFGPVIAAMAISVFDLYEKINRDQLDQS